MQRVAKGCRELQTVAEDCSEMQSDTRGCSGKEKVAMGYEGMQKVAKGCKSCCPPPSSEFGACVCSLPIFPPLFPPRHRAVRCRYGAGAELGPQCPPWTRSCTEPALSAALPAFVHAHLGPSVRSVPVRALLCSEKRRGRAGKRAAQLPTAPGRGEGGRKTPIPPTLPLRGPEINVNGLMGTPRARPTAPPAGAER